MCEHAVEAEVGSGQTDLRTQVQEKPGLTKDDRVNINGRGSGQWYKVSLKNPQTKFSVLVLEIRRPTVLTFSGQ